MEMARREEIYKRPIRVLVIAPTLPIIGGQTVQAARLVEALRNESGLHADIQSINPSFFPSLQKIKYVRTAVTSIRYVADLFLRIPKYDIIHIFSASFFLLYSCADPSCLSF